MRKMIKKAFVWMWILLPALGMAQGHKGSVADCAPMKEGKVVYSERIAIQGASRGELFNSIHKWAVKNYGKDVFFSNMSANKNKGTIRISSKIELLLNDKDKTTVKFKMRILCDNEQYAAEVFDIEYLYDPMNEKKFKSYPAEDVIANHGKGNQIAVIKDPALFCNATYFFVENLFGDVFDAAKQAAD